MESRFPRSPCSRLHRLGGDRPCRASDDRAEPGAYSYTESVTHALTEPTVAVVCEIERSRALRLLDESSSPVVVVSAPAGSGKSILARQWASRGGRPHATVRVAIHMDDPVVLGAAMVDALETLGPPAPDTRVCLTGKEPAFSATVLPAMSRLVQNRDEPFILVVSISCSPLPLSTSSRPCARSARPIRPSCS
jgi:hypothetical protein